MAKLKANLLAIEERKTEFIDPRSVPLDLLEAEKQTLGQIARLEARLGA